MTKQTINVGTSPNDNRGDSLRASFQKINANFTELYTALGLDTAPLNIGAFEFTGSVLSTTDSTAITIDQATTITSNLTVGGDVLPSVANGGDLGSAARPWKSLYVSNSTIYIGGNSLGIDNDGELVWNNNRIAHAGGEFITLETLTDVNLGSPQAGDVLSYQGGYWTAATVDRLINGSKTVSLGSDGALTLPSTAGVVDRLYSDNGGYRTKLEKKIASSPTAGAIAKLELDLDNGHIRLAIGNYTGGNDQWIDTSTWAFRGDTGSLTLPPAGKIINNNKEWTFGTDGALTLPGDINSNGNINIEINLSDSTLRRWQFGEDGELTFPDRTTTTGKSITLPVDQSLTVNTSYSMGPGGATTFKISPEHIKLPTGNGTIFSGTETAANSWGLDSANKTLYFPDAGDGVNPQIYYSKVDGVTGMELMTYAKSIKITAAQTNSWTFGTGGRTTFPNGTVPAHSYGAAGDKEGMVVFSDPYIYYCKQDYVDNSTDIWVRVAWTGTNW